MSPLLSRLRVQLNIRLTIHPIMIDGGIGITAAVAFASKFVERSKFSWRHEVTYDKEVEKSQKIADRFQKIPREDIDYFEAEEYNALHSR